MNLRLLTRDNTPNKNVRIKIYKVLCSHTMQNSVAPLRSMFIMPLYSGSESAPSFNELGQRERS